MPVTEAVTDPPEQTVAGVSVIGGGRPTLVIFKVVVPVHPLTVCVACNCHGPTPVKFSEALELLGP